MEEVALESETGKAENRKLSPLAGTGQAGEAAEQCLPGQAEDLPLSSPPVCLHPAAFKNVL